MRFAPAVVVMCGCSFVGVRGPGTVTDPPPPLAQIHCTQNEILPNVDAAGGAAAIIATGGGIIIEHASDDKLDHFTLYYAGPLLAVAVAYWISTSVGNSRIARCTELREKAAAVPFQPTPIDSNQRKDTEDPNRK